MKNQVPQRYFDDAQKAGKSIHQHLTDISATQAVGEHGLVALDWHSGNRSVLVDHELSGILLGATLTTKAEDGYRALLESTAFGTRKIVETFASSGVPVKEFIVAGGLLIVLSLLPKAAFLVASIPPAVLGGAAIAMFGMVAATGIKILQEADIADRRNQLLVAVSVGMGLIPVVRPEFFAQMPQWMEPITHSGIAMATLSALTLNLLFNILGGAERAAINDCHAHPH